MVDELRLRRLVSEHGDIETTNIKSVYFIKKHEAIKFLNYYIIVNVFNHKMEFKVFEFQEFTEFKDIKRKGIQFPILNGGNNSDFTEDIFNAQCYFEGAIKWDGCSDVVYSDLKNCMLHYCGLAHARESWLMFEFLYKYAEEHIENWRD